MYHYFADGKVGSLLNTQENIVNRIENNDYESNSYIIEHFYNEDMKPPPPMIWHSLLQGWNDANILNNMWKTRVEVLDKSMEGYQQAFDDAIKGFDILVGTLNNLKTEYDKFGEEQKKNIKKDIENIAKSSRNAIVKSDENIKDHEDRYQTNRVIYATINIYATRINIEFELFETAIKDYKAAIAWRVKEINENDAEIARIDRYIVKAMKDAMATKQKPPNFEPQKKIQENLRSRNETLSGEIMMLKMFLMQAESSFKQMQEPRPEALFILEKYNKFKTLIEPKIPPKWISMNDAKIKLQNVIKQMESL